jgi:uncharacterized protein (DUF1800 family)
MSRTATPKLKANQNLQWHREAWFLSLALAVAFASGVYAKSKQKTASPAEEQKRALHTLDRVTFGPRPGDVQAVAAYGVDKWIELELHPDKIDDTSMQVRLASYRTLQMSTRDMLLEFPPEQIAKAVIDGKIPMPREPYRHAVYTAAIARVQLKQAQKQNVANAGTAPTVPTPKDTDRVPIGGADTSKLLPVDKPQRQQDRRDAHSLVDDLVELPPDARMQRIMGLAVDQQRDLTQGLPYPKREALFAGLSPEQRETVQALNNPVAVVNNEAQSAKLLRAVYSDRQLEEVLTDFWFNHFNIFINKGADRYLVTAFERDVIRPHVLGKFKDLLIATAKSPAMLFYLDNWQSEGPSSDAAIGRPEHAQSHSMARPRPSWAGGPFGRPVVYGQPRPQAPQSQRPQQNVPAQVKRRNGLNENYGRELMELQTLGVNGGYTQQDVTEVARVFTGWTLAEPREGGDFVFRQRLHEPGDKIVLGHTIKEGGEKEGMQVLELLASQPATARFISTELAQRFISDSPPQSLVDAMSKAYLKTDGDLREVMRTMFRSREFWAPEAYRARVKTPLEFVASSLRAMSVEITDPQPLLGTLNKMGMPLYGMQPPTGYSTKADVWVNSSALLDRMNFGIALATNNIPGTTFDLTKLTAGIPSTSPTGDSDPYQVQLKLEQTLLSGDISKQTHETIEQKIVSADVVAVGTKNPPNVNVIAGLLLGSPEFQRK